MTAVRIIESLSAGFPAETGHRLTLAELEALARAGLAGLLAFFLARIAAKEARLLQGRPQGGIDLNERAGQSEGKGAGLADESAAVGLDLDVELLERVGGL